MLRPLSLESLQGVKKDLFHMHDMITYNRFHENHNIIAGSLKTISRATETGIAKPQPCF